MDALDRVYKPFGKKERREFAIKKQEEEMQSFLDDENKVKKTASKFEAEVRRQRRAAGLC